MQIKIYLQNFYLLYENTISYAFLTFKMLFGAKKHFSLSIMQIMVSFKILLDTIHLPQPEKDIFATKTKSLCQQEGELWRFKAIS